jgi:hypothetical protein
VHGRPWESWSIASSKKRSLGFRKKQCDVGGSTRRHRGSEVHQGVHAEISVERGQRAIGRGCCGEGLADAAGATLRTSMKATSRSWRLLILAWAVLLAPQIGFVHALSHSLPASSQHQDGDDRHHVAAQVCHTCLAVAQLGAALPSRFEWVALEHAFPVLAGTTATSAASRYTGPFDARAPPVTMS